MQPCKYNRRLQVQESGLMLHMRCETAVATQFAPFAFALFLPLIGIWDGASVALSPISGKLLKPKQDCKIGSTITH